MNDTPRKLKTDENLLSLLPQCIYSEKLDRSKSWCAYIIRQLLAIREEIGNILTRGTFYSNRSRQRFNKSTLAIFETPVDDKCNPTYLARQNSN